MVNINQFMKQAQAMQKKMQDMQEKIAAAEFIGTSGGGLVKATINGKGEFLKLGIDASLKEDIEMLEDLVIAAFNDAKKKADEASEGESSGLLSGLNLPAGFKLPM